MASKGSPKERISRIFKRSNRSGSKGSTEAPETRPSSSSSPQSVQHSNGTPQRNLHGSPSIPYLPSQARRSGEAQNRSNRDYAELPAGRSSAAAQQLPHIQQHSDLSKDFESLTFDTRLNEGRHAVNIADRNISKSPTSPLHTKTGHGNLRESLDRERPSGPRDLPAAHTNGTRTSRDSVNVGNADGSGHARASHDRVRDGVPRSSLEKPLPGTPSPLANRASVKRGIEDPLEYKRAFGVKDSATPIDLNGIVDLTNTQDTTLEESWAPAVTHQTIVEEHRHIREEVITREIHHHDVYHRILPIIDIEVKPARHFIPVEGGYAEIAEEELPGRVRENAKWAIAEFVSKATPQMVRNHGPRQFTARTFEGDEGCYKESRAPEGHLRTHQTWVHPPTIEEGAKNTGQTYAFHFGSPDPKDDGLRARLPHGDVIGTSEVLARKLQAQQGKTRDAAAKIGGAEGGFKLPPMPAQRDIPADWEKARRSTSIETPYRDTLSPRFI